MRRVGVGCFDRMSDEAGRYWCYDGGIGRYVLVTPLRSGVQCMCGIEAGVPRRIISFHSSFVRFLFSGESLPYCATLVRTKPRHPDNPCLAFDLSIRPASPPHSSTPGHLSAGSRRRTARRKRRVNP
jgi:hypothetical protein